MSEAQLGAVPSPEQLKQMRELPTLPSVSPVPTIAQTGNWLMQPAFEQQQPSTIPSEQDIVVPKVTEEMLAGRQTPQQEKIQSTPTQDQIDAEVNKKNKDAREANAIKIADAQAQKEIDDMERVHKERTAEVNKQIQEVDNRVRTKSLRSPMINS